MLALHLGVHEASALTHLLAREAACATCIFLLLVQLSPQPLHPSSTMEWVGIACIALVPLAFARGINKALGSGALHLLTWAVFSGCRAMFMCTSQRQEKLRVNQLQPTQPAAAQPQAVLHDSMLGAKGEGHRCGNHSAAAVSGVADVCNTRVDTSNAAAVHGVTTGDMPALPSPTHVGAINAGSSYPPMLLKAPQAAAQQGAELDRIAQLLLTAARVQGLSLVKAKPKYRSRRCTMSLVQVKIPYAEPEDLEPGALAGLQAAFNAQGYGWQVSAAAARRGCIELTLQLQHSCLVRSPRGDDGGHDDEGEDDCGGGRSNELLPSRTVFNGSLQAHSLLQHLALTVVPPAGASVLVQDGCHSFIATHQHGSWSSEALPPLLAARPAIKLSSVAAVALPVATSSDPTPLLSTVAVDLYATVMGKMAVHAHTVQLQVTVTASSWPEDAVLRARQGTHYLPVVLMISQSTDTAADMAAQQPDEAMPTSLASPPATLVVGAAAASGKAGDKSVDVEAAIVNAEISHTKVQLEMQSLVTLTVHFTSPLEVVEGGLVLEAWMPAPAALCKAVPHAKLLVSSTPLVVCADANMVAELAKVDVAELGLPLLEDLAAWLLWYSRRMKSSDSSSDWGSTSSDDGSSINGIGGSCSNNLLSTGNAVMSFVDAVDLGLGLLEHCCQAGLPSTAAMIGMALGRMGVSMSMLCAAINGELSMEKMQLTEASAATFMGPTTAAAVTPSAHDKQCGSAADVQAPKAVPMAAAIGSKAGTGSEVRQRRTLAAAMAGEVVTPAKHFCVPHDGVASGSSSQQPAMLQQSQGMDLRSARDRRSSEFCTQSFWRLAFVASLRYFPSREVETRYVERKQRNNLAVASLAIWFLPLVAASCATNELQRGNWWGVLAMLQFCWPNVLLATCAMLRPSFARHAYCERTYLLLECWLGLVKVLQGVGMAPSAPSTFPWFACRLDLLSEAFLAPLWEQFRLPSAAIVRVTYFLGLCSFYQIVPGMGHSAWLAAYHAATFNLLSFAVSWAVDVYQRQVFLRWAAMHPEVEAKNRTAVGGIVSPLPLKGSTALP